MPERESCPNCGGDEFEILKNPDRTYLFRCVTCDWQIQGKWDIEVDE